MCCARFLEISDPGFWTTKNSDLVAKWTWSHSKKSQTLDFGEAKNHTKTKEMKAHVLCQIFRNLRPWILEGPNIQLKPWSEIHGGAIEKNKQKQRKKQWNPWWCHWKTNKSNKNTMKSMMGPLKNTQKQRKTMKSMMGHWKKNKKLRKKHEIQGGAIEKNKQKQRTTTTKKQWDPWRGHWKTKRKPSVATTTTPTTTTYHYTTFCPAHPRRVSCRASYKKSKG